MKRINQLPSNTLVVCALLMLCAAFLQSCKKNQVKENAPVPNIVNPANTSFDATLNIDSTLFKSLIAYWPLQGSAYDLSGNGNKGVLHDLRLRGADYVFNGHQSYVAVPDAVPLRLSNTDFSISVKVSISAIDTGLESDVIAKRTGAADEGWHLAIEGAKGASPGALSFGAGDGMATAISKTILNTNVTYTVACVYTLSNHTLRIYVNGALDTAVSNISSPNAINNAKLCIGSNYPGAGGGGYFFSGPIDDIFIFNRALTMSEVHKIYAAVDEPMSSSIAYYKMIAYWPLAHTYSDISGNNCNGTGHNVTPATDRFGNPLGASKFNGKNSYVTVNDTNILRLNRGVFSINAWIKIDSYDESTSSEILSKRLGTLNSGWNFSITGNAGSTPGALIFGTGKGKVTDYGIASVPLNGWHMITCVYSYPNMEFYIDGVFDTQIENKSYPNPLATAMLYIGSNNDTRGAAHYFNGSISDVRIFERVLYAQQIHNLLYGLN